MGQFITVTVRPGASDSVRFFDLNRSLTGMAIERFASAADVKDGDHRPTGVLAKRLFDLGAKSVTVYSSSVAVTADAWARWSPRWSRPSSTSSATTATTPAGRPTRSRHRRRAAPHPLRSPELTA